MHDDMGSPAGSTQVMSAKMDDGGREQLSLRGTDGSELTFNSGSDRAPLTLKVKGHPRTGGGSEAGPKRGREEISTQWPHGIVTFMFIINTKTHAVTTRTT